MISGGNATIIVANMDNSIRFYTEVLGLQLTNRFGNDWATVSPGEGLTIGIHPASPKYPHPGTKGSIILVWTSTFRSRRRCLASLDMASM
jgi:catechol 2,3-dioxygenase-like lactoylglutathione lyase family enzyme